MIWLVIPALGRLRHGDRVQGQLGLHSKTPSSSSEGKQKVYTWETRYIFIYKQASPFLLQTSVSPSTENFDRMGFEDSPGSEASQLCCLFVLLSCSLIILTRKSSPVTETTWSGLVTNHTVGFLSVAHASGAGAVLHVGGASRDWLKT